MERQQGEEIIVIDDFERKLLKHFKTSYDPKNARIQTTRALNTIDRLIQDNFEGFEGDKMDLLYRIFQGVEELWEVPNNVRVLKAEMGGDKEAIRIRGIGENMVEAIKYGLGIEDGAD